MDVEAILDKLESLNLVRLSRRTGNYRQCYCPFHNGGNEKKPSCGVLLKEEWRNGQRYPEGFWHCFSCGAAYTMPDAITEILKNHSITQSGQDWLLVNIPGYNPDLEMDPLVPSSLIEQTTSKYALNYIAAATKKMINFVSEEELAKYRFVVPYMYERRLTDEVIEKYDIGVDMNWIPPGRKNPVPCITFPVHDINGNTLFIMRRSIQGKLFNYPEGVTKPVYGIDMIPKGCKSVLIVESCFNALTAAVYGYNAVALFGTGNAYQIEQLKRLGVQEYVICTDGDEAGRRAANKLKKALSSVAMVWTVHMPPDKDVNDMTKDEFDEVYSRRD